MTVMRTVARMTFHFNGELTMEKGSMANARQIATADHVLQCVTDAQDNAEDICDLLQDAHKYCSPVEAIILLRLIESAATMNQQLKELAAAFA